MQSWSSESFSSGIRTLRDIFHTNGKIISLLLCREKLKKKQEREAAQQNRDEAEKEQEPSADDDSALVKPSPGKKKKARRSHASVSACYRNRHKTVSFRSFRCVRSASSTRTKLQCVCARRARKKGFVSNSKSVLSLEGDGGTLRGQLLMPSAL